MLIIHVLLLGAYAVTPIFYAAILARRWRQERSRAAMRALGGTVTGAVLLGGAMSIFFAVAVGARPRYDQALLATFYFMTVMIALKGLMVGGRRIGCAAGPGRRRTGVGVVCQILLVGLIGVPYIMAAVMTYRPKVAIVGTPLSEYRWPYQTVTFKAADGVPISGWWIPAPAGAGAAENGDRTVLLGHGLGANKLNQLHMARLLYPLGYNVLTFDFRAHGESGGQFTTYGDHERRDVLAAVRWLKTTHPGRCRRIVGVGASLGAAALLAAATEEASPLSRKIDALVLYGTYADLGTLSKEVPARFPPPLNWLASYAAVPLASVHAGADLQAFAPVRSIAGFSPRPVMIVHGRQDEIIPVHHGQELFAAAGEPKRLMLLDADHNSLIEDDATARAVVEFLRENLKGR